MAIKQQIKSHIDIYLVTIKAIAIAIAVQSLGQSIATLLWFLFTV